MIYNTKLLSGHSQMAAIGQYFSLIAAAGIVELRLFKQGKEVFYSKFWVGMNLVQPIDFDHVIIKGEPDSEVEFWASNVSMQQNNATIRGAKAIRTSTVEIMGSAQLTGSDLTRTAVRLRSDMDVHIGGAGVNGAGWLLKAGQVEEFPIAGVLYGYRDKPQIDITKTTLTGPENTKFPKGIDTYRAFMSADEKIIFQAGVATAKPSLWKEGESEFLFHPQFVSTLFSSSHAFRYDGALYLARMRGEASAGNSNSIGELYFYRSDDDGLTFTQVYMVNFGEDSQPEKRNNSGIHQLMSIVGDVFTYTAGGMAVGVNLKTKTHKVMNAFDMFGSDSSCGGGSWLDNDMQRGIFLDGSQSNDVLKITENGGQSWREVMTLGYTSSIFAADKDNILLYSEDNGRKYRISNDGGENFTQFTEFARNGIEDIPIYLFDGMWVCFYSGALRSLRVDDGGKVVTNSDTHPQVSSSQDMPMLMPNGDLLNFGSDLTDFISCNRWKLSINGDLTPAKVEVMELLS